MIHAERPLAKAKRPRALALKVRDELLIKWLVTLVWRRRNIAECRIGGAHPNLFKARIPDRSAIIKPKWVQEAEKQDPDAKFWQFRFSEDETKMGNTLHSVLPQQLVSLLEEYLELHRVRLCNGEGPDELFVRRNGKPMSKGDVSARVMHLTARHGGNRTSPHIFRDIVAYEWLKHHPADYLTLSKILWHKNIQMVIQVYGSQFNESSGVCGMDEWLEECEAKDKASNI